MGLKYLQVAVGQQRSSSLGGTKLSCDAECSITQMFFVFAVRAQSCNNTALKKRGSYDHSKPSLTSRTMAVINPPFISNFVWNLIHGRPNQWGQHTENNGGARPRGKQGKPAPVPILPSLRSLPCKECWSSSICGSVPATRASVWTGRSDLRRPAVALPSLQLETRSWTPDGKQCFLFL